MIGELEVGGDSGPNGDIVLTLQENRGDRPMVTIVHQTKRIVLNGKLDKEVSKQNYRLFSIINIVTRGRHDSEIAE